MAAVSTKKKNYLYSLAKKMNATIRHAGSNHDVTSALIFKQTTQIGMARLFRNLAY